MDARGSQIQEGVSMSINISPAGIAALVGTPLVFGAIGYFAGSSAKMASESKPDSSVTSLRAFRNVIPGAVSTLGIAGLGYAALGSGAGFERGLSALGGAALITGLYLGAN